MWGPGAIEQWHSDDERIAVGELINGAIAYRGMIEEVRCARKSEHACCCASETLAGVERNEIPAKMNVE